MRYIVVEQPPVPSGRASLTRGEMLAEARTLEGAITEYRRLGSESVRPLSLRVLRENRGVRETCALHEIEQIAKARAHFGDSDA